MPNALAQIKEVWSKLSLGQRGMIAAAALGTLGILGAVVYYGSQTEYGVLFSDLKPADAQQIVEKLKAQNVDYTLSNNGTAISVPADKVSSLRLEIAGAGDLSGGHVGFDLFDKTRFGTTDFEQQVNYQRAIEGELAKTIEQTDEVESARVHVVKPKESLFTDKQEPAKASVQLRVRANRQLSPERVAAVVNLVSSAVEGLTPENVTVSDTSGRILSAGNEGGGGMLGDAGRFNSHLEARRKLEEQMAQRVVALLEPVTGPGGVRADVSADLDFSQIDETSEKFDPKSQVIRSQQSSQESRGNASGANGGVVGARANDPSNPASTTTGATTGANGTTASSGDQRVATTTNYEIDRTTRHVVGVPGNVSRLSVSVVVDFKKISGVATARTPEELATLQQLVTAAVGLDAARGDQVVVQSIPFDVPEETTTPPTWLEAHADLVKLGVKYGMLVFAVLLLLLFVVRPARKAIRAATQPQLEAAPEPLQLEAPAADAEGTEHALEDADAHALAAAPEEGLVTVAPKTVAELEAEIEAKIAKESQNTSPEAQRAKALRKKLIERSLQDPEMIAMTMRGWLKDK